MQTGTGRTHLYKLRFMQRQLYGWQPVRNEHEKSPALDAAGSGHKTYVEELHALRQVHHGLPPRPQHKEHHSKDLPDL